MARQANPLGNSTIVEAVFEQSCLLDPSKDHRQLATTLVHQHRRHHHAAVLSGPDMPCLSFPSIAPLHFSSSTVSRIPCCLVAARLCFCRVLYFCRLVSVLFRPLCPSSLIHSPSYRCTHICIVLYWCLFTLLSKVSGAKGHNLVFIVSFAFFCSFLFIAQLYSSSSLILLAYFTLQWASSAMQRLMPFSSPRLTALGGLPQIAQECPRMLLVLHIILPPMQPVESIMVSPDATKNAPKSPTHSSRLLTNCTNNFTTLTPKP